MKIRLKQAAGFTLIEIVIFLLVAAIILPAIVLPFVEGTRNLNAPTVYATMSFLAQEELERNTALSFNEVTAWSEQSMDGFPEYYSEGAYEYVDPADFETETDSEIWKKLTVTISHGGTTEELQATAVFYVGVFTE